jgi:homoaconitase/3-isopropylmalate dehydratase large subunit
LRTDASISESLAAQGFIGQYVNIKDVKVRSTGIDGKLNYRVERLDFELNFTRILSSDNGFGSNIAYQPLTLANIKMNIPINWLNVNIGANYRGDFTKADGDTRDVVKNYVLVNANLIAKLKSVPLEFSLGARNLFNSDIRYPSSSTAYINNFPARKIEILVGAVYRF